ncbi:MAG: alkaline phosphatase family protein, partial [Anaerolineae bacterium]|nr:alkaline phosphatase family protein [Anaerolineae bacterium]
EQGHLPHLQSLLQRGSHGMLRSTLQPLSAPAWATFMTGANQGRHGLYDFVQRQPDDYRLQVTNASFIKLPLLFEAVSQHNQHVLSVNVPMTSPPRPVNGVMVGGPFAPVVNADLVYPPELGPTLLALVNNYVLIPDFDPGQPDPLQHYARELVRATAGHAQLTLHLLDTQPWDFCTVVFTAIDEVQHAFWHCMTASDAAPNARFRHAIRDVYQQADAAIGELLRRVDEETLVIVMSDHGFGPLKAVINLNSWLAQAGYLTFSPPSRRWRAAGMGRLAALYRRLPAAWRVMARKLLGTTRMEAVRGDVEGTLFASAIEWTQTRAYALGAGGKIYLNVAGREPSGIVQPGAEYTAVREALAAQLATLADPQTGVPLIHRVWRREELYEGPYLEAAPDLVIEWADYGYWGRGRYDIHSAPIFEERRTMDFSSLPLTATHTPEGIFIACGPGIPAGGVISGAQIADVAPTLLCWLGLPVPEYMDGVVLPSICDRTDTLTPGHAAPVAAQPTFYADDEAAKVAERLKGLGYL